MIDFGAGVYLDTIDVADPDQLRAWRNDYRVWRYCRQHDLIPKEAHLRWYDRHCDSDDINKMYCVCDLKTKNAVGVCGITNIDHHNRNGEFSLYINPNMHGKGLGRNALRTLFSHGFMNLGLQVIWGETFAYNPAKHLFTKIGMIEEGTRRNFYFREGGFIDAILFSLTRQEWEDATQFDGVREQRCLP